MTSALESFLENSSSSFQNFLCPYRMQFLDILVHRTNKNIYFVTYFKWLPDKDLRFLLPPQYNVGECSAQSIGKLH